MKLLKPKVWSVVDLACMKWSSILFGMIAGSYFADFTQRNVWLFTVGCIVLAIKPIIAFFRNSQ
jgi:hypothetical protein